MPKQKIKVDLRQVENLAARGLDNEKVCLSLGISSRTFYRRKSEAAELDEALKRGRAKGEMVMSDKLWELATEKKKIRVQNEETGQWEDAEVYAHDDRSRLDSIKFWLERRAGWAKADKLDLSSSDGSMSPRSGTVVSLAGMDPDEVARMARAAFKGE